ncbi:MAG: iron-sulfur cluster carrier protein MrpORP [Desulfovibrionaceae bacterium]
MSDHACGSCSSQGGCGDHGGSCGSQGDPDQKLHARLARIRNKIVVLSGKGGVGKSTTAVNIAVALSLAGKKVGLMDVDVHGPSAPRLLSLRDAKPHMEPDGIEPVPWSHTLSVISLGFLLPNAEQSVIWRGPVKSGLIKQFIEDVMWGDLDYLVVDCPPGTGDEPMSVLQFIPDAQVVIVTTPQGVAVDDVRRSVSFCREMGAKVLGIVENMSGFVCSQCGHLENIFNAGGGEALATEMHVPFLGAIPLDPEVVRAGDEGFAFLKVNHESATAQAIGRVVKPILALSDSLQELVTPLTAQTMAVPANGERRIAVPVADGMLCQHFGHCQQFALIDVDPDRKAVTNTTMVTPPPHEPGVLPAWLKEQGAELILAGGMGSRAQSLFTDSGIRVVTGVPAAPPMDVVAAYLGGKLTTGANTCDH